MKTILQCLSFAISACLALPGSVAAQNALTWQDVRNKFAAANASLRAGQISIDVGREVIP